MHERDNGRFGESVGAPHETQLTLLHQPVERARRDAEYLSRLSPAEGQALIAAQAELVSELIIRLRRERRRLERLLALRG